MLGCYFENRIHFCHLTKKMYGYDSFGSWSDRGFELIWIEIVGCFVYVDKNWCCPG